MIDLSIDNIEDTGRYRTLFARDKDRIFYSRDFLRLGGKTQIFVDGYDDHMRNRLSHTLEVASLAKKIANSLKLNIDLTEAIAFGHDIGHTPFGHAGERVLNKIMNGCYKINDFSIKIINKNRGFKHNWQGIRVARDLNERNDGKMGLHLSKYTEWGILRHTKPYYKQCNRVLKDGNCGNDYSHDIMCKSLSGFRLTFYNDLYKDVDQIENFNLESLVVESADEIAQRHHDIEDGIIANLVSIDEIIKRLPEEGDVVYNKLFEDEKEKIKFLSDDEIPKGRKIKILSHLIHGIYTRDLITNSIKKLNKFVEDNNITEKSQFFSLIKSGAFSEKTLSDLIDFSEHLKEIDKKLKKYLKSAILNSMVAQSMDSKAEYVILKLFSAYLRSPQYLPKKTLSDILNRIKDRHKTILKKSEISDVREFIADKHLTKLHNEIYINYFMRGICDFIAGMTDDFAYKQFDLIYGTKKIANKTY